MWYDVTLMCIGLSDCVTIIFISWQFYVGIEHVATWYKIWGYSNKKIYKFEAQ